MTNTIWTRLVVPLTLLFVFALFMNSQWKADGFFINLATEVIGIILTISYVNWVLEAHEKRKWQIPDARVKRRIELFVDRAINDCMYSLQYKYDSSDWGNPIKSLSGLPESEFFARFHEMLLRILKNMLAKDAAKMISNFDEDQWKQFIMHMQSIYDSAGNLLLSFGDRLTPEKYTLLIDIQDKAESMIIMRDTIYKNILGSLSETTENADVVRLMKRYYDETIVTDLSVLAGMLEKLFKTVNA